MLYQNFFFIEKRVKHKRKKYAYKANCFSNVRMFCNIRVKITQNISCTSVERITLKKQYCIIKNIYHIIKVCTIK